MWWCFLWFPSDEPCWTTEVCWTWSKPVFCLQNSIWPKYNVKSGRTWTVDSWLSCYTIPFEQPCIYPNKACLSHVLKTKIGGWCWDVMTDAKGSVRMRVQVGFYVASRTTEWVDQIASPLPCQNRSRARVNSLLLLHVQTPRVTFFSQDKSRLNRKHAATCSTSLPHPTSEIIWDHLRHVQDRLLHHFLFLLFCLHSVEINIINGLWWICEK